MKRTDGIAVIGAGLAGCEAAFAAAERGIPVTLYEMKPTRYSPAHTLPAMAELVCSNSLKAESTDKAAGLLKEEMRRLGSVTVPAAFANRVAAGGALAVDREGFAAAVTEKIRSHPLITVVNEEITAIPAEGVTVIATGPLTDGGMAASIAARCGGGLSFFDAAAPIVTAASVDMERAFVASRYGDGEEGDYINCPMNREEYEGFHEALVTAEVAPMHDFDRPDGKKVYEGCMPIEVLAGRGRDAIRFGPMKPVGLRDPRTGHRPWAVLQLRAENADRTMFNLVGFQTHLKFPEQKRVFGMIPALHDAEYVRYGVMHRNTFLRSPELLTAGYQVKDEPRLFFAGQMTGVEGYMESAGSGLIAGINAARTVRGEPPMILPRETMLGALAGYISTPTADFQPMGANHGILPSLEETVRDKKQRGAVYAARALAALDPFLNY